MHIARCEIGDKRGLIKLATVVITLTRLVST